MKLYVFPPSPNARKVLVVARHLGLEPEIEIVDLPAGDTRAEDYLELNPNGLMPTLVDGDFVLWESHAIMQYLCSMARDQTLWPSEPRARADVSRWQFWQACHWGPACGVYLFENLVKGLLGDDSGPDVARLAQGEETFHRFARVLDGHLAGRRWMVGESPTLADLSIGVSLGYADVAGIPLAGYDEIVRWNAALDELPAWRETTPAPPAPPA